MRTKLAQQARDKATMAWLLGNKTLWRIWDWIARKLE